MTRSSRSAMPSTAIAWWRSRMEKLSSGPPRAARDRRCCRASAPLRRQGDDHAGCRHDRPRPLHGALAGSGTVAGRKLRTATPDRSDDDRSSRSRRTDHPPHARRAVSRQPDRHARGHGRGHRVPLRGAGCDAFDALVRTGGLVCEVRDDILVVMLRKEAEAARGKQRTEEEETAKIQQAQSAGEAEARKRQVEARREELALAEQQARGPLREETIRLAYAAPEEIVRTLRGLLGFVGGVAPPPGAPG